MAEPLRKGKLFHLAIPWVTIYAAILIPALTLLCAAVPSAVRGDFLFIWATSPFNIYFELAGSGIVYNYFMAIALILITELFSRNASDIRGAVSLMDHAFAASIFASYATSAFIWISSGVPSAGTSIIAFSMLLFFILEALDFDLLQRMSGSSRITRHIVRLIFTAFGVAVAGSAALFYFFINPGSSHPYIHLVGGTLFLCIYAPYALKRRTVEREEHMLRLDAQEAERHVVDEEKRIGREVEDTVKKELAKSRRKKAQE